MGTFLLAAAIAVVMLGAAGLWWKYWYLLTGDRPQDWKEHTAEARSMRLNRRGGAGILVFVALILLVEAAVVALGG